MFSETTMTMLIPPTRMAMVVSCFTMGVHLAMESLEIPSLVFYAFYILNEVLAQDHHHSIRTRIILIIIVITIIISRETYCATAR